MTNVRGLGQRALLLGRLDRSDDGTDLINFDEASHLLTIAPNRSHRNRFCLIPNLLTYAGHAVVVDLDGEAYAATAEARRQMGHAVVRLDPFGLIDPESDALNPLDLVEGLEEPALTSACQDLAHLIPAHNTFGAADESLGLLAAVIGYLSAVPERRSFDQLYSVLNTDDAVYSLAVVLDTIGKKIPKMSYAEISAFLQKEDSVRSRDLKRAQLLVKPLGNLEVQRGLSQSSVPLSEMFSGPPVTVYMVMPAERLAAQSMLLRIWIGTLLQGALRAARTASMPMLFLLDYCAELGAFPLLESLLTVGSGKAIQVWTFWHDLYQLRTTYPSGWSAITAGCGAIQVFGTGDGAAAAEAEALLGLPFGDVSSLGPGEQIVLLDRMPCRSRKLDLAADLPPLRPGGVGATSHAAP